MKELEGDDDFTLEDAEEALAELLREFPDATGQAYPDGVLLRKSGVNPQLGKENIYMTMRLMVSGNKLFTLVFNYTNAAWNQPDFIAANEEYVFPKIKRRKAYLKADYDLRENVTLYGRADVETVKNYVDDGEFSKRRHNEFTSGISLTF